jgi:Ca-activated chloride channel homolog
LPRKMIYSALACLFICSFPFSGYGKTLAGAVKEGNAAYNAGEYDKAVAAYDEALKEAPDSPYVLFDKGAALYKKGDYKGASDAFQKAASGSKDKGFEAKSRFNLGNSAYKEAEAMKGTDLQKALEGCSTSLSHYREALTLDPALTEAAENIEMVRRVMKNILEEQKKQKESGKEDQEKKQQTEEKLKDIIKEQEAALEKNKQIEKERSAKGASSSLDKRISDLADEQTAIKDKTEALAKEVAKDGTKGDASDDKDTSSKHLGNAVKEQDAAAGNLGEKNTKEAAKNQEDAVKELKEALDSEKKDDNNSQGNQDKKDQQGQQKDQQQEQQQSAKENQGSQEAQQGTVSGDASDILKEEKENKDQRKALILKSYKEVDKDW